MYQRPPGVAGWHLKDKIRAASVTEAARACRRAAHVIDNASTPTCVWLARRPAIAAHFFVSRSILEVARFGEIVRR
jgi:hypothetical protein